MRAIRESGLPDLNSHRPPRPPIFNEFLDFYSNVNKLRAVCEIQVGKMQQPSPPPVYHSTIRAKAFFKYREWYVCFGCCCNFNFFLFFFSPSKTHTFIPRFCPHPNSYFSGIILHRTIHLDLQFPRCANNLEAHDYYMAYIYTCIR